MSLALVTVTGRFLAPDLTPLAGTVTFTPSVTVTDTTDGQFLYPAPVKVTLDGTGAFTTALVSSNNALVNPQGFTYSVTVNITTSGASSVTRYDIVVPISGPVDLSTLAPVASSGGTALVPTMPLGGAANTFLAKTSTVDYAVGWRALVSTDIPKDPAVDLTLGAATMPRYAASNASILNPSGQMHLTYFAPKVSFTATKIRTISGSTAAAATPTLCRVGLYSVAANGDLTLIASAANDTTLWAAAGTRYTSTLTASVALNAGQRYAVARLLVTAFAIPSFVGALFANDVAGGVRAETATELPIASAVLAGQTDLPATVTSGSLSTTAAMTYAVVVP